MAHPLLQRQLKRAGIEAGAPPSDPQTWNALMEWIERAYTQADQDRYLLERSLAISSNEMRGLHVQLAAERDTLRTVIWSLGEGLCALDASGCILFINPEAERILGLSGQAVVGRPLTALVDLRNEHGATIGPLGAGTSGPSGPQEARLLIGGETSTVIVYGVSPLAEPKHGVVLKLRDVTERRRIETEREELNKRLLEISRSAGMAEVAAGVLHNVGNVLNSVNVSAALATDRLKRSRLAGLSKAVRLLREHAPDLGRFLTQDQIGNQLPEYLGRLAETLMGEQESVLAELESLTRNIDHIKEIVATQQTYAKVAGVRAVESLEDLCEDSIRVNATAFTRHSVRVAREYSRAPKVLVDKNQVLQILINLISNAKNAVSGLAPEDRVVTVRIAPIGSVAVRIEVIDRGVGIPAENLTRIFSHGFTTRQDGHGFGLHSAALAAKSLGASLRADSEGPGRGATFTLEVPLRQETPASDA